jgi:RNA polymerase sigma-70 factor (ECF subfamily)
LGDQGQQELIRLVGQVAAGDRAAFDGLYRATVGKLYGAARRILGNEAAAEDAVQEAYARIWRRAGDFDARLGSPIAWMTTIARHAAIDVLRRGAERVSAAGREIDEVLAERLADPNARVAGENGKALADCLARLDGDRRTMVLLAYCNGWSREELSNRFARPVATVKTILRRSLIALKECLGERD